MLDKGYKVVFIIVSLNPYIKQITIDKNSDFYDEISKCMQKGMILKAYSSHLVDYHINVKKEIQLLSD